MKRLPNDCSCAVCGNPFRSKPGKSNRYCSMECYRVAQRRHEYHSPMAMKHVCEICQKEYNAGKRYKRNGDPTDHRFCSRACYDEFRSRKNRRVCAFCGSPFYKQESKTEKYCSDSCWRKDQAARAIRFCTECGQSFIPWQFVKHRGAIMFSPYVVTCSPECQKVHELRVEEVRRAKISIAFRGDKHPSWIGGRKTFRGETWKWTRREAMKRDGNRCQICGITDKQHRRKIGKGLEVHHKVPFRKFATAEEANKIDNLVTLCTSCHKIEEWKYREAEDATG